GGRGARGVRPGDPRRRRGRRHGRRGRRRRQAARARRDEAPSQGDGGGGRCPPRDAGQGRQGDARSVPCGDPNATTSEAKEEMDSRSVFVGNVDYACTPEEVQQHFNSCGTVNRVTILTDKFGQPKGFAYVEFVEAEAIQEAVKLSESELHGRQIKVAPKRTNVPGLKQPRGGRGFNPYGGHPYMRPYPPPFYNPYGGYG
uniref:RRM domain-containing protein n=1 Tax=Aegilops tauschii subsp. strangulata TaxID=200361 RepID=A0A453R4L8_AEGTS